jgi:hypothetical protein
MWKKIKHYEPWMGIVITKEKLPNGEIPIGWLGAYTNESGDWVTVVNGVQRKCYPVLFKCV